MTDKHLIGLNSPLVFQLLQVQVILAPAPFSAHYVSHLFVIACRQLTVRQYTWPSMQERNFV